MRAQQIYEKLVVGDISMISEFFPSTSLLANVQALRMKLEVLDGIPGFEETQKFLQDSIIFRTDKQRLPYPDAEWHTLFNKVVSYNNKLQGLKEYLEAELKLQNPDGVFVKFPPVDDLRKLIQYETRVAVAIEQLVFNEGLNAELKISSWEKGSFWVELAVGGPSIVSLLGTAAWAGAVVYKKIREGEMFAAHAKGLNLKNESLESLLVGQKKMIDLLVETEARNIEAEYLKGPVAPETFERIKFSIREFSDLIREGAEIHPALNAPENVRNLFPDFKKLATIESKTKLLEDEKKTGT